MAMGSSVCFNPIRRNSASSGPIALLNSRSDLGDSLLERAALVPVSDGSLVRIPSDVARLQGSFDGSVGQSASSDSAGSVAPDGVEAFRRRWQVPGVSESALIFLPKS
ncbi:hypothetical protein NDU88_008513 [Pleurodeles waltl]|uniref:Uncharacterized protein n=1 Tax=Pleurodeles waltl TaxID=8319 RepID=A0AAV7QNV0_PLEWA|nr:hypothetical protein NDU88_008513 [Pleurodeles waltl]